MFTFGDEKKTARLGPKGHNNCRFNLAICLFLYTYAH